MSAAPTLQDRVTALEQALGKLAADSLQPNVLTVNADGTIGADFTGTVFAEGLSLGATDGGANATNMIQWVEPDGTTVAAVYQDIAAVPGVSYIRRLVLKAIQDAAAGDTAAEVIAYAEDSLGDQQNALILDSAGRSSFPIMGQTGCRFWPQQQANFSIAAGAGVTATFNSNGWNTTGTWHPILWLLDTGGGFTPHCTLAVTAETSSSINVGIVNNGSGTANGKVFLVMLTGE